MDRNVDPQNAAIAPEPEEDQNQENERRQMSTSSSLLESAIDRFAREGGFDDLPLKGKTHQDRRRGCSDRDHEERKLPACLD